MTECLAEAAAVASLVAEYNALEAEREALMQQVDMKDMQLQVLSMQIDDAVEAYQECIDNSTP